MIALYNFTPHYCPNCGADTGLTRTPSASDKQYGIVPDGDYRAGASHSCDCGLSYQYAPTPKLLAAASEGDLAQYV